MMSIQIHSEPAQNVLAAHKIRLKVPDTEVLTALNIEEAENITNSKDWNLFGNISIKKVDGVTVSQFAWLDGKLSHNVTAVMASHLLTGDQGPILDANLITMWPGRVKSLNDNFRALAEYIMGNEPDFKGFVGMTVTINERAYYQRIFTRVPYDFLVTFGQLHGEVITADITGDLPILIKDMEARNRYACSMRVYDYPYDSSMNLAMDVPEGVEGHDSYIVTGTGPRAGECWDNCIDKVKELKDVCYRTDGSQIARRTINELKKKKII